jgi:hypothetical protein
MSSAPAKAKPELSMKWFIHRFTGSESIDMNLFPGDLLLHFRTPLLAGDRPAVLDLWQMQQTGKLWVTSKPADLPPGFELRFDEVCNALAHQMLAEGTLSRGEKTEAPNIWRVRAGDRLATIGQRSTAEGGVLYGLFQFDTAALVYWLRQNGEMPLMEEAMTAAPSEDDTMRLEWARRAFPKVAKMGAPKVMDTEWRLG